MEFLRRCWGFVLPLSAITPLCLLLMVVGIDRDVVELLSMLLTWLVLMVTLGYIVFFDSRKRWVGVGAFDRLARIVTFYRR